MRNGWTSRPYVARLQLAGALLVSIITLVDIVIFFVGARRLPSLPNINLWVLTFTVIVFALGAGVIQGYRAVGQARSALDTGDSNVALTVVLRQFLHNHNGGTWVRSNYCEYCFSDRAANSKVESSYRADLTC